jgi:hypothetical protein
MKEVEFVNKSKEQGKPVEFTHSLLTSSEGMSKTSTSPSSFEKIAHLGKDFNSKKDLFAAYNNKGFVVLYLGHLNSGMY